MRLVAVMFALLLTGVAHAAPLRVQTGEHADFTRVVVLKPPGADWDLRADAGGYVLQLPVKEGYDLARFYALIPRDRISVVSQDADKGVLRLGVDCRCHVAAFADQPGVLVIDIRDGDAPSDPPPDRLILTRAAPFQGPENAGSYTAPRNSLLPIMITESASQPVPQPDAVTRVEPAVVPSEEEEVAADLVALEQSVAAGLGRALSQGLLDAAPSRGDAPEKRLSPHPDGLPLPGLRATTGIDIRSIPSPQAKPITQDGAACAPDDFFAVDSWGDDRSYTAQIAAVRAAIPTDDDGPDETAVTALARTYVYFGFGREALQVLALDGATSQERRYLAAMAQVIDDLDTDRNLFAGQPSCDSHAALWATLVQEPPFDARVNRAAVLRSFKALPPGLQTHLAPALAARFVAIGDTDAAAQAVAIAASQPDPQADVAVAAADLSRALGDEDAAVRQVAEIVSTDARITPEVMITRLQDAVRNNAALTEQDFILADAMRFENAQRPAATDLTVAQLRAYLHLRDFTAARDLLGAEQEQIAPDLRDLLWDEFASVATRHMPDRTFLEFAFEDLPPGLSPDTENAVAQRLLDLGFAGPAADVIAGLAVGGAAAERAYLRAGIALALDDPDQALIALSSRYTDRANRLRGMAEDMRAAGGIMPEAYVRGVDVQDKWRRGDWVGLRFSDDPLLQAASTAVLTVDAAALNPEAPLTSGRALLDQSAQSRAVMDDLLDRFASPADF